MTTSLAIATAGDTAAWPVAGLLINALAQRDFAALASCLDPEVRFRALIPPGPFELTGANDTTKRFQTWFGGDDGYEVLDAGIGQVGNRMYLRWRIRMMSADGAGRVVEQHVFATAGERIQALELLCSGFQPEARAAEV
ncbi:nuclear transport factor 2 family protein [Antrihabitans cavernicola]|uniref:Nuclear transport factor 2 family protein n=1 Tax=Antrihabitans cavernicola TaxID=2495913 RepID=A0A5A7SF36_9NOCA|nr:nuclear transport factor 2 family protein [Spelaeibacter cavernicola]KAA0024194.1 nuclear transport factor 2 family protein [Spelaeibacter cavernicola]